ncbi:MAG: hypothetical protein SGPRY_008070 [Prymnesium sp.]
MEGCEPPPTNETASEAPASQPSAHLQQEAATDTSDGACAHEGPTELLDAPGLEAGVCPPEELRLQSFTLVRAAEQLPHESCPSHCNEEGIAPGMGLIDCLRREPSVVSSLITPLAGGSPLLSSLSIGSSDDHSVESFLSAASPEDPPSNCFPTSDYPPVERASFDSSPEHPHIVSDDLPSESQNPRTMSEDPPTVSKDPPTVSDDPPHVSEDRLNFSEDPPHVSADPHIMSEDPPVVSQDSPIVSSAFVTSAEDAPILISPDNPPVEASPLVSSIAVRIAEDPPLPSSDYAIISSLCKLMQQLQLRVTDLFTRAGSLSANEMTPSEFRTLVRSVGHMSNDSESIDALFGRMDSDGDGLLSQADLHSVLRSRRGLTTPSTRSCHTPPSLLSSLARSSRSLRALTPARTSPLRVSARAVESSLPMAVGSLLDEMSGRALRIWEAFGRLDEKKGWGGEMDQEKLRTVCEAAGLSGVETQIAAGAFSVIDNDGDGLIQGEELRTFLLRRTKMRGELAPGVAIELSGVRDVNGAIQVASSNALPLRRGDDFSAQQRPSRAPSRLRPSVLPHCARLDLSHPSHVPSLLIALLKAHAVRAIDLFRDWDADLDGMLSREEFIRGIRALAEGVEEATLHSVFEEFEGKSALKGHQKGAISFKEWKRVLREGGGEVKIVPSPQRPMRATRKRLPSKKRERTV